MLTRAGHNKIALVTGASRGLGFSLSYLLAKHNYTPIIVARTVGGLEELDDKIRNVGGKSFLCVLDITKPNEVQIACKNIYDKWGLIDLWFHTAILASPLTLTHQIDLKTLEGSIATNITATSHLITCVHPLLKKTGQAFFFDDPRLSTKFMGVYGSTKRAQIELAKTWNKETTTLGPKVCIHTPAKMYTKTTLTFHPGIRKETLSTPDVEAQILVDKLLTK